MKNGGEGLAGFPFVRACVLWIGSMPCFVFVFYSIQHYYHLLCLVIMQEITVLLLNHRICACVYNYTPYESSSQHSPDFAKKKEILKNHHPCLYSRSVRAKHTWVRSRGAVAVREHFLAARHGISPLF